jgi:histidyl-tRNA synthetase
MSGKRIQAKVPKGTRDADPEVMAVRERVFRLVADVFQRHGAVSIDTPVFERREVLQNKYGEDSKLIYDLADDMNADGAEKLSLRYDLSVPFARYVATNNLRQIKRYQIAKVYRRDKPAMDRGRFREFYQCDFDIAADYPPMVADAEVLKVMTELFDALSAQSPHHAALLSSYRIKLSHRAVLDAILSVCGVPPHALRAICSAVDKLDKEPWAAVRAEMVGEKGLDPAAADAIGGYVDPTGRGPAWRGDPRAVLAALRADAKIAAVDAAAAALDGLDTLFTYVDAMGGLDRVSFDLSLARGLDYYTGIIFEVVLTDPAVKLGSIGAGGRYDNLVGMFRANSIPCVGCSLGVERIMEIMLRAERSAAEAAGLAGIRTTKTLVYVATVGKGSMPDRLRLASELWAAGVPAQFCYNAGWALTKQVSQGVSSDVPFIAVVGETELAEGVVKLKCVADKLERTVPRAALASEILASAAAAAAGCPQLTAAAPPVL